VQTSLWQSNLPLLQTSKSLEVQALGILYSDGVMALFATRLVENEKWRFRSASPPFWLPFINDSSNQFHCSMTMTDTILWVKEARTCSYVLVIHTPRLCGEPGFKSRQETRQEAFIRCREIIDSPADQHNDLANLPPADHPHKLPRRKIGLNPPEAKHGSGVVNDDKHKGTYDDIIRKALEAIVGGRGVNVVDDNEGLLIEFVDEVPSSGEVNEDETVLGGMRDNDFIVEALRAVGYDVQEKKPIKTDDQKTEGSKEDKRQRSGEEVNNPPQRRDEL
jgi:protein OS-9